MAITQVKNQIRPRQKRIRIANADMLQLDTVYGGMIELIGNPLSNALFPEDVPDCIPLLRSVDFVANVQVDYGSIDAAAEIYMWDPISFTPLISEAANGGVSNLLAAGGPVASFGRLNVPPLIIDTGVIFLDNGFTASDLQNAVDTYTIAFFLDNGGADLTGGDAANYFDLIVYYEWVRIQ